MKVVHISTADVFGGAGRAAYRLHKGLRLLGVDSNFVVQRKFSADPFVHPPRRLFERLWATVAPKLEEKLSRRDSENLNTPFSPAVLPDECVRRVTALSPDVINLHWVNFGFLRPESLKKFQCPIIWTLHDMWPFTGGCHTQAIASGTNTLVVRVPNSVQAERAISRVAYGGGNQRRGRTRLFKRWLQVNGLRDVAPRVDSSASNSH